MKTPEGSSQSEIFYFGSDSCRKFGVLHRPESQPHTGLVFCPPYGEEMVASYSHFTRWAKELAREGFAVLRYHPCGTGESDGEAGEFTVESAVKDAVEALACFREHVGLERIGFFGLRFGGLVAVQAALKTQPDFLVLWSPVTQPRQYCRELLRLLLTKELVHQQAEHVRVTTKGLVEALEAGRPVDIMGYEMSPDFYRQMTANPPWPDSPPARDVLWLSRPRERDPMVALAERWKTNGNGIEFQSFDGPAFWEDWEFGFPERFAEASVNWLMRMTVR